MDLRDNRGGEVNELYKISDLFLDKGNVIGIEDGIIFDKTAKSKHEKYFEFKNICILQNQNTASASEGFIMSVKQNLNNVTVIGTKSFGKGIGQVVVPLKHGYAVKATVIKILTPNNGSIHKEGITPDIFYEKEDIIKYATELY